MTFREFLLQESPEYAGRLILEDDHPGHSMAYIEVVESFVHRVHPRFIPLWNSLPANIKTIAQRRFHLMQTEPKTVELKPLNDWPNLWQAKVNNDYRALAVKKGGVFMWYWIGPREELNQTNRFSSAPAFTVPPREMSQPQRPLR